MQVGRFPELEGFAPTVSLVDLDAEAGRGRHDVARAVERELRREELASSKPRFSVGDDPHSSQAKFGTAAARCTVAAVQIGPSGLCGIRST